MLEEINYSAWRDEYKSTLEHFNNKKLFVLFSGGKDSSLTMDFILQAGEEFGFGFEVHTGAFPKHRYTRPETKRIGDYWSKRGANIIWHTFSETDELIKNTENPCRLCQKIRKNLLKTIVTKEGYDLEKLVLVVTYSLWDIVGYSIEHILSDIYQHSNHGKENMRSRRFVETAQRFYPLLKMEEGYSVFRPLIRYNGSDIIHTLKKKSIPFLSIPCEFSDHRPKRILEKYYEKMGLRLDYERVMEFATRALDLPAISAYTSIGKDRYFQDIF